MPSSSFGPLFETLIVTDFWKRFFHHGQMPSFLKEPLTLGNNIRNIPIGNLAL